MIEEGATKMDERIRKKEREREREREREMDGHT